MGMIVAAAVSVASVAAASLYHRDPPPPDIPAPGMTTGKDDVTLTVNAPEWRLLRLGRAEAATARWSDTIPARVQVDETKMLRVSAPLAGRVTRLFVERGQAVKAGSPLFSVASSGLAELRAEIEKSDLDQQVAKSNFDRVQALVEAKSAPAKEVLAANQELRHAEMNLKLAKSKLAALRIDANADNSFTIVAPTDGVVLEKTLALSQQVSPEAGDPLIVLADLSSVWIVADLFEQDAGDIKVGTKAKVIPASRPDLELEGVVDQVSAVVDPTRHTVPVRVRLPNMDRTLRPNVYAQVRFLESIPGVSVVEVASTAVISDGEHTFVYVQDHTGHLARRQVVAGSIRDGRVPVLSGLTAGEMVVEEGTLLLDNQIALAN
jgi:RND family efflux transporter MFP subunit